MAFTDAPALPTWLERKMPFRRRAHRSGPYQVSFVDEGEGPCVLLMHGNPTWSYLYRRVIPPLVQAGLRCVVPDLVGFGTSDKPPRVRDHSLRMHIDRIAELVDELDLQDMTVVGQDWGGPVAAGVACKLPARVRGAVFANTAVLRPARPFRPKAFHRFAHWPVLSDLVFRGLLFPLPVLPTVQGDRRSIGINETLAYTFPFRRPLDRAGPLALARMVPNAEDHPSTAVMEEIGTWAEHFDGRVALVWGSKDPILGRALRRHREVFTRAKVIETEAGHFLQEEIPEVLASAIIEVARS